MFEKYKYDVLVILSIFLLAYLLGSFVAVSFNPAMWAGIGRFMLVLMGLAGTAIYLICKYSDEND